MERMGRYNAWARRDAFGFLVGQVLRCIPCDGKKARYPSDLYVSLLKISFMKWDWMTSIVIGSFGSVY